MQAHGFRVLLTVHLKNYWHVYTPLPPCVEMLSAPQAHKYTHTVQLLQVGKIRKDLLRHRKPLQNMKVPATVSKVIQNQDGDWRSVLTGRLDGIDLFQQKEIL
jgi:hypothetical protein